MVTAIGERLKVSRSTVSLWLRDVNLNTIEWLRLLRGRERSRYFAGVAKKKLRIANTQKIFDEGKQEGLVHAEDPFFVAGVMLYWAEGAKTNERIKFVNSDPIMIRFMMDWFKKVCNVPLGQFRISLHIHSLHMRPEVELYWSKITGIPKKQFYKTQIKKTSLGQRRNILYNGTCSLCVYDVKLFRRMSGWKAGILAKLGISMKLLASDGPRGATG